MSDVSNKTGETYIECDVCRDPEVIEHATNDGAWSLCEAHKSGLAMRVATKVLRDVIPGEFHKAKPSDLPQALSKWVGDPGKGLYFYGPVGCGKSHAAAAILKREWMRRYRAGAFPRAVWFNVPIVIVDSLDAFSQRKRLTIWQEAKHADVLVIDDIGIEVPKDWIRMNLYAIVEYRLHRALPTIVTSNLNLEDLGDHLGSVQIASRLSRMTTQVSFEGRKDLRPDLSPSLE